MTPLSHLSSFVTEMQQQLVTEEKRLGNELHELAQVKDGNLVAQFPEYGEHDEENAMEIAEYQARSGTVEAIETRLKEVQAALARIEHGTYGVTSDGQLIPEARLRANPAATTLVE